MRAAIADRCDTALQGAAGVARGPQQCNRISVARLLGARIGLAIAAQMHVTIDESRKNGLRCQILPSDGLSQRRRTALPNLGDLLAIDDDIALISFAASIDHLTVHICSYHRLSPPGRMHCVVVDAAWIEPVSHPKFPDNRENNREFCGL